MNLIYFQTEYFKKTKYVYSRRGEGLYNVTYLLITDLN